MSLASAPRAAQAFAWLGGAAFVLSLAQFAYFYAHGIDRVTARGGPQLASTAVLADTVLFTVFALHHSITARLGIKTRIARLVTPRLERSVYVWIASVLFVIVCAVWQPIGRLTLWTLPNWTSVVLQGTGLVLIGVATRAIDPLELAGIRQVLAQHRRGPARISHGFPYSLVRHPIYLGWLLATFGATPMTADRWLFASLAAIYVIAAVPWEERSLRSSFGDDYQQYSARVRWRIIPGLY